MQLLPSVIIPAAIFAAAFFVRLIYIIQLKSTVFFSNFLLDEAFYDVWAAQIAGGRWLGSGAFNAMPLYPYMLGSAYRIFGYNLLVSRMLNAAIGSLTCVLIYIIAKKAFGKPAGIIAGIIAVLYSQFIFYSAVFVPDTLAIFLCLVAVLCFMAVAEKNSIGYFALFGAVSGLAALTRAGALFFAFIALLWLVLSRKNKAVMAGAAVSVLVIAAVIAPVTIRNYVAAKEIVLITSHGGINFYIGNNEAASGTFKPPFWARSDIEGLRADSRSIAEARAKRSLTDTEVSRYYYGEGFKFIAAHPFKYARLLCRKLLLFLNKEEIYDTAFYGIYQEQVPLLRFPFPAFILIGSLGFAGLIISVLERRYAGALYIFMSAYAVSILLFFVNSRYRLPFVAALVIFAGFFIHWFLQKARAGDIIRACGALLLCAVFFIIALIPTGIESRASGYINLGNTYMEAGRWEEAKAALEKAAELNKYDPKPYNDIAYACISQENLREAGYWVEESLKRSPSYPFAHINKGLLYEMREMPGEAEAEYMMAIKSNPNLAEAHNNLANIYEKTGRRDMAIAEYRNAIAIDPYNPKTHYNLGVIYGRAKQYLESKMEFEKAVELDPGLEAAKKALKYFE